MFPWSRRNSVGLHIVLSVLCVVTLHVGLGMCQTSGYDPDGYPFDFGKGPAQWPMAGQNLHNTRFQDREHQISPRTVHRLEVAWTFPTENDVSVTPTVHGNALYFFDWADAVDRDVGGNLYALDRMTGTLLWTRKVSSYTGVRGSMSRTSPTIAGHLLLFGTWPPGGQARSGIWPAGEGARVIAVNRFTGDLAWSTLVETYESSQITAAPIVYRNRVFVGVSSGEEGRAEDRLYPCCVFRGSVLALDVHTGAIVWQAYMVPEDYTGGAVWGALVIDERRGALYVATGNNYSVPPAVVLCQNATPPLLGCDPRDAVNYFNAVVALNLRTGAVRWATWIMDFDTWTRACFAQPHPNCPVPTSPDYDFAAGVALYTNKDGTDVIGAGNKDGAYYMFNPDYGYMLSTTQLGPGGTLGGVGGSLAVDRHHVYLPLANNFQTPYTRYSSGEEMRAGSWSAVDKTTGAIVWQVADPNGAMALGSVSSANGVVFAGSMDAVGTMYAFDGTTGRILWRFASGGSINSGPAIVDGHVYWGCGYQRRGIGAGCKTLYAFGLARR